MKLHLLVLSLLFSFLLQAQDTITSVDMPKAGDTLRVSYSNDSIDPAPTDTNYVWDFSKLKPNAQWINRFYAPQSYPFPFNFLFSNTTFGQKQYIPDSIMGIKPENAFAFFKLDALKLQQSASGLTINSLPLPTSYTINDTIYHFPLVYGKIDSSDAKFGNTIPNIGYYGQKIHRVNYTDGWGTLITPYDTVETIRVKTILHIQDTLADTSGIGFVINRPIQYEFKWFAKGGKIPHLQIIANEDSTGTKLIVSRIVYRDSIRDSTIQIGIEELNSATYNFHVYPNPAASQCMIEYTLSQNAAVTIDLFDLAGKNIAALLNSKQNIGKHVQLVNLSDKILTTGLYFIRLQVNDHVVTSRLVINK